jgi:hypothetical protein
MPIGATLVVGPWEELGIGGLLWDGVRLVAIHHDAGPLVAGVLGGGQPPVALQIIGLRAVGVDPGTGIAVAGIKDEPGALVPSGLPPSPPISVLGLDGGDARWVSVVGRLDPRSGAPSLIVEDASLSLDRRCERESLPQRGTVSVTGVLLGQSPHLVVPCGGIVPAPLLARGTAPNEAPEPSGTTGVVTARGSESPPGSLPAVLLLLAATTLAAGASAARWASRGGSPEPDSGAVAPQASDEPMSPPALTLVSVPRERAP